LLLPASAELQHNAASATAHARILRNDGVLALATPDKNLVPEIGILGVEIDKQLAPLVPDLSRQYGIIVAARATGAALDVPVLPGDVIVAMNDVPTMTLDYLRTALKRVNQSDPVVLRLSVRAN
jgi:S1-C subfamily serine protease